jgi:competence protein ComEC
MNFAAAKTDRASYQPLLVVFAAASMGIVLDSYWPFSTFSYVAIAILSSGCWCLLRQSRQTTLAACSVLVLIASVYGLWHHRCWYHFSADDLGFRASLEPSPVLIEGALSSAPTRMPAPLPNPLRAIAVGDRTRFDLRVVRVRDGQLWLPASGNAAVMVDGHVFDLVAGDRVQIAGHLVKPSPAMNPGGFDYQRYCRGNRVLSLVRCGSPSCVQLIERSPWWSPQQWIDRLRAVGEDALWKYIAPRNAGLAAAMFLGLRDELDAEQLDAFRETGTVHLLVISGLNVGILAGCILLAFRSGWLSDRTAIALVAAVTVLYTLATGAQPPVVRATVLVLVFCVAKLTGRQGIAFNSLAAAALIVLAINPIELFRPGTQLSFLAVAALIAVGQSWLTNSPASPIDAVVTNALPARIQITYIVLKTIWQWVLVSFVVWIVVQPLVAARFNLITPSAILLGPILAVPVTIAMAAGFGVMAVGWLMPPLGMLFGFVCNFALTMVTAIVDWAHDAPFGKYSTAGPADWWLAGYYALLAAWVLIPALQLWPRRRIIAMGVAWTGIGAIVSILPTGTNDRAHVAFLSVGHGLAVVVELPDGKTLLYDAGSMGSPELAARAVAGYLFSRHIGRLDQIVISHADADHYNAIPRLLEQFRVGQVAYGPTMFREDVPPLRILRDALVEAAVPVREVRAGETLLQSDQYRIEVAHPPAGGTPGSDNANSIVLKIKSANHTLLLTGDLEPPGLDRIMSQPTQPLDVVLVPHHGSRRSDPHGFAAWAQPHCVVVSGSMQDRNAAVHAAYSTAGAAVYHTAENGAVEFDLQPGICAVRGYLGHAARANLQRFYNRQTAR